jgi:PAS domain S-box-containing protein
MTQSSSQRQPDAALKPSDARFRSILDHATDALFVHGPGGAILDLNQHACDSLGYEQGELLGRLPTVFDLEVTSDHFRQLIARLHAGETVTFDSRHRRKDGSEFPVEVRIRPFAVEGQRLALSLARDITDRKRVEAELRASRAHLEASQRIAGVGSWELDLTADEMDANPLRWTDEAFRIFGYEPGQIEVTNDVFWERVHPDDRPRLQAAVRRALATRSVYEIEHRIVLPGGAERIIHERAELVLDERTGRPLKFIGTSQDITARKQAEAEHRRLEDQVRHAQKLESLGVLAGGLAHDFNNLLTSVLGYAALAEQQLPPHSAARPMLEEIERAAQRAAELTRQMLAYSGRGKFVVQVLGLGSIVQEMSKLLRTVVSKKADFQFVLGPAAVEGDAAQLRQIVMNLITNASDALGQRSGSIAIRTGTRQMSTAELRSPFLQQDLPPGEYAWLEVADDGCGMTDESLSKIFDPFYTTKFAGRGLGLAAVLGIVRGHRGSLHVTSSVGQGTTFRIYLPAASSAAQADPSPPAAAPHGRGLVLVVEDEANVAQFVEKVLTGAGFEVALAGDGKAGVEAFQRRPQISAVVLDLTMPQMDGWEVLSRLTSLRPEVPVLLISGYSDPEFPAALDRRPPLLHKPFRPQELVSQLCQLVQQH